jgi:adenylyl- and sulfurtransferase ThiI
MDETEKKLQKLMSDGWNLNIEGKSCDREYANTFEITARRTGNFMPSNMKHSVGDTLLEALNKL